MIIAVSIVDRHKPVGKGHVGTYTFEIDYPGDSHFSFHVVPCAPETEHLARRFVGRLMTKAMYDRESVKVRKVTVDENDEPTKMEDL
jgi:hypothetical protein